MSKSKPNRKLRFLFVTSDSFPPFRVDVSILFGKEIAGRGHTIEWLMQSQALCTTAYQTHWSGGHAWVGPTNTGSSRIRRLIKHLHSIALDFKLFAILRSDKYDFIQVKDKFIAALMAIVAARIYKIKFLYWLSYPFPEESLYAAKENVARYRYFYFFRGLFWQFLLYQIILPCADHVFVQSEQMKRDIMAKGIPESKLTPIPMGISADMILPSTSPCNENKSTSEASVVYLGTMLKVRRMDFLIRVFSKVLKEIPHAKLYMIGDGDGPEDLKILKEEAHKLGIQDSVVFTGFIPREQALQYVINAGVCVSPFYPTFILNSTSPTKLIEYMAMGKAVVANDHPEQKLVISQSGAGLCVPYEEDAFAKAIVQLLNSPQLAKDMGIHGKQYVEQHRTYDKIADLVESKYFQICGAD